MKQRGETTPRIEDSGSIGGIHWTALLHGAISKHASAPGQNAAYASWFEQGRQLKNPPAGPVITHALLDASDWFPFVASAPATGSGSLLAGIAIMGGMRVNKKGAQKFTVKEYEAVSNRYQNALTRLVSENIKLSGQLDQRDLIASFHVRQKLSDFSPADQTHIGRILAGLERKGPDREDRFNELTRFFDHVADDKTWNYLYGLSGQIQQQRATVAQLEAQSRNLKTSVGIIEQNMDVRSFFK